MTRRELIGWDQMTTQQRIRKFDELQRLVVSRSPQVEKWMEKNMEDLPAYSKAERRHANHQFLIEHNMKAAVE